MYPASSHAFNLCGRLRWLSAAVWIVGVIWTLAEAVGDPEPRPRHPAIIVSAYFAFAMWAGSVGTITRTSTTEWRCLGEKFRLFQLTWLLGSLLFLLHVAAAFHFAHGWRHTNAFDHVEATSGFGPGIFVSYLFTLVWLADSFWACLLPARYVYRLTWLGSTLHTFLAFIAFNGTVVYGYWPMRGVAAVVFAILAILVLKRQPVEMKVSE